jgi:hypothetical protein
MHNYKTRLDYNSRASFGEHVITVSKNGSEVLDLRPGESS